jgi:hypothetical protein
MEREFEREEWAMHISELLYPLHGVALTDILDGMTEVAEETGERGRK